MTTNDAGSAPLERPVGRLEPERDPCCARCGAPITTGMMAAFCPHRERCEFWPEDEESQRFLDDLGLRLPRTPPKELA